MPNNQTIGNFGFDSLADQFTEQPAPWTALDGTVRPASHGSFQYIHVLQQHVDSAVRLGPPPGNFLLQRRRLHWSTHFAQHPQQTPAQPQVQPQKQPPAQNPTAPSLSDLGLSNAPDPALQARLDRHTQMLKMHQRLGLITLIPMAAAVISSGGATAHHTSTGTTGGDTTGRDVHAALGGLTVAMYGATAYYAIAAPRIPESHVKGGIKVHKYLIWIHGPGMVLTPILGVMAYNQLNNGEKVHGIASAHAAVAWTTVASYTAAIIAVSWPIKL